jgi:hypothetical protein
MRFITIMMAILTAQLKTPSPFQWSSLDGDMASSWMINRFVDALQKPFLWGNEKFPKEYRPDGKD